MNNGFCEVMTAVNELDCDGCIEAGEDAARIGSGDGGGDGG